MKLAARVSPTAAHVLPLAALVIITSATALLRIDNPLLPWWRHSPEQWIYPLQTILVGALLFALRPHYDFKVKRGFIPAIALSIIGTVFWIAPAWCYHQLIAAGAQSKWWWDWFGITARTNGFNPTFFRDDTFWYVAALVMRFIRMVVIVSFAEEVFWRSFLMRYIIAGGHKPFQQIPFGTHSWPAYLITTLAVMLAHNPSDYFGAFIFGSLMYWLAVRTKSLAACVLMHAMANLALGLYVVLTRQWGFW